MPRVVEQDGGWRVEGLPPWLPAFELSARTPDGAAGSIVLDLPEPGRAIQATLSLAARAPIEGGGTVRGRFTIDGEPEQGRVAWRGATRTGSARVDRQGAFVLERVEPGPVTVTATSERVLARGTCGLGAVAPRELFLRAGEELELDLALDLAFAPIAGRVTVADGRPAAGVRVEVADPDRCWRDRAWTDGEGRFAFEVPSALSAYTLELERLPEVLERRDVLPGTEGLDFVLGELGRLRFRVVDADSRAPIERGLIEWRRPGGKLLELVDFGRLAPDPGGWYEVDCVTGAIDLTVSTHRDRHRAQRFRGIQVHPATETKVEFELREALSPRVVLGQGSIEPPGGFAAVIVHEAHAPKVRYVPEPRPRWHGLGRHGPFDELRFKANGTARARGLAPGRYRILVWPETLAVTPESVRLRASEPDPTVRVRLAWR